MTNFTIGVYSYYDVEEFCSSYSRIKNIQRCFVKILLELFDQAGSAYAISDSTAKSWLSGNRNCKASTHFPAGKIDADSLFRYFRKRPDVKLKQLQQIFRTKANNELDSPIDTETDDLNVFCWSLVNQFLDLLGFQRVDITDSPALPSNESAGGNQLCDKCCLYCIHWQGDKSTVGPYRMPTSGLCSICLEKTGRGSYSRLQKRLSSSAACANNRADQSLISNMKRIGYNVDNLI